MKKRPNQLCLPFVSWLLLIAAQAWSQTPAPALQKSFSLPLTDGTTATAMIMPGPPGQSWLVYAAKDGKLGTYWLTPTDPGPGPKPVPPVPPIPQRLTIVIVEDPVTTTQAERQILADPTWRTPAAAKHNMLGIIPNDLIDKETGQPPQRLAGFLDRAKLHNLPWIMLTGQAGTILWEGQVPTTAAELIALIKRYGG
jgi:hypothetical protein